MSFHIAPEGVKMAEYEYGDEVMFVLWNHGTEPQSFSVFERPVLLSPEEVCCIVLKRDEITKNVVNK